MTKLIIRTGRVYQDAGLDITVKNNPSHVFAPPWQLVLRLKNGDITPEDYAEEYYDIVRKRWKHGKLFDGEADYRQQIIDLVHSGKVTLLCFCRRDAPVCHRWLAADILKKVADQIGIEAEIIDERNEHEQ